MYFSFSHACYMLQPWFHRPNNIWRREQIMKLLIMQFSTQSCYFLLDPNILFSTLSSKVKVKLSLCLTKHYGMKTYWGSGCITPRIHWPRRKVELNGLVHAPAALFQEKEPLYPSDTRLGVPQTSPYNLSYIRICEVHSFKFIFCMFRTLLGDRLHFNL
jgi:hypothetical protein